MSSDTSPHPDPAPLPPAVPRRGPARVFLGSQGLRAGWSCLLFLALLVLPFILLRLVSGILHHHAARSSGAYSPRQMIVQELISLLAVGFATFVLSRVESRPLLSYGLTDRSAAPRFAAGLLCGFAAISALVGFLWLRGLLTLSSAHLGAGMALRYGLAWLFAFLCVALFEENLLRGYLLQTLGRGVGFWPAAFLLSALFGLMHHSNSGESAVGLFSAAAVGLFFCLTLWYTGSLWWAIGFHATWDWGESFFWSTSDSGLQVKGHLLQESPHGSLLWSGGLTGPEGSLWILPLLALCALLAWLWWRRRPPALAGRFVHRPLAAE